MAMCASCCGKQSGVWKWVFLFWKDTALFFCVCAFSPDRASRLWSLSGRDMPWMTTRFLFLVAEKNLGGCENECFRLERQCTFFSFWQEKPRLRFKNDAAYRWRLQRRWSRPGRPADAGWSTAGRCQTEPADRTANNPWCDDSRPRVSKPGEKTSEDTFFLLCFFTQEIKAHHPMKSESSRNKTVFCRNRKWNGGHRNNKRPRSS